MFSAINGKYTNFKIHSSVSDVSFAVHKAVICANSPRLDEFLKKNPDADQYKIDISDIAISNVLAYLYDGELGPSREASFTQQLARTHADVFCCAAHLKIQPLVMVILKDASLRNLRWNFLDKKRAFEVIKAWEETAGYLKENDPSALQPFLIALNKANFG